jgi:hypothetical protein
VITDTTSGSKISRKGLEQLMKAVRAGKVDIVLCCNLADHKGKAMLDDNLRGVYALAVADEHIAIKALRLYGASEHSRQAAPDNEPKGRRSCGQAAPHRSHQTLISQREFKARQHPANHQFHFKLRKRHPDAAPSASTKGQILIGRKSALSKPLRPETIRVRVDFFAAVRQVNRTHDYCARLKRVAAQLNRRSGDSWKRKHTHGVNPQRFAAHRIQIG